MKIIVNVLLILLAIILQTSLLPKIDFFGTFPNLVLLIMLSLLFINRTEEALWWTGGGGILLDLVSPARFGIYTFSLLIIFILTYILVSRIFSDPSLLLAAVFFFVASLLMNLFFLFLTSYFLLLISTAIYDTLVGCIIYGLVKYYYKPKEAIKI